MDTTKIEVLLENIRVAKILSTKKHENADRLQIVMIDAGGDEPVQIVTAATNISEGDFVPYLGVGHVVPGWLLFEGQEIKLEARKMRGEMSYGMILAEDEIGLGEDHEGIMILNDRLDTPDEYIGKSISEALGGDVVISVLNRYEEEQKLLEGLRAVVDEIIGEEDLKRMIKEGDQVNHYIGFEISGLVHLGTGLIAGLVIRELQKLGVHTKIFLADWHTWINDKLDGDMELIEKVAKEYFGPAMRISAQIAGADPEKIEFVFGTELYDKNNRYWQTNVDVSKNLTLSRVRKSTTIMGREDSDSLDFAKLFYPIMQVADIFEMQNHIAHAGTDQRKAHVIAREVAEKLTVHPLLDGKGNKMKPIAIHHALVPGLQKPSVWPLPENVDTRDLISKFKMSKSVEGSAIFVQDTPEQIRKAISKAFCPEKEIGYNPVLAWVKQMIFPIQGEFELIRDEQYGGSKTYTTYEELENDFAKGEVFPLDLKNNVARILIEMLEPARRRFDNDESKELIGKIRDVRKKR